VLDCFAEAGIDWDDDWIENETIKSASKDWFSTAKRDSDHTCNGATYKLRTSACNWVCEHSQGRITSSMESTQSHQHTVTS